jgi:hypothetical protein
MARKNSWWTRRATGWKPLRGPSAWDLRTVRQERRQQPELDPLKVNPSFLLFDLLNQPRESYQIIGEGEVPLGDAMPMNLEPKTHWDERNLDSNELNQKARFPTEIHESEAESSIWGIENKDAQDIYLWFPQRKPNTNASESTNRATHENPPKIPPKIT